MKTLKRIGGGLAICLVVAGVALALSSDLRDRARWWSAFAVIALSVNMDEDAVPTYSLPDVLETPAGGRVASAEDWLRVRRPAVLALFEREIYGKSPPRPTDLAPLWVESGSAFEGRAVRRLVSLPLSRERDPRTLELLVYLPADARGPVPVFLALNFWGNHSIGSDPDVPLSTRWLPDVEERGIVEHRATAEARGASARRWPVEMLLERGYGLATAYYGDLEPDHVHGRADGIRDELDTAFSDGETPWGAISAWSWGLRRAMDHLAADPAVDPESVIVLGHSRLGKAALWAAAQDERFAAAISNDSGCMGAALSRRRFGETIAFINRLFPHWFPDRFDRYSDREDELPVDQHMLLALIAPRPLYVASAREDRWADPRGEFLAAREASRVYALFGVEGIRETDPPPVGRPILGRVAYHVRAGEHDLTREDWSHFLDFADREVRGPMRFEPLRVTTAAGGAFPDPERPWRS